MRARIEGISQETRMMSMWGDISEYELDFFSAASEIIIEYSTCRNAAFN